MPDYMKTRKQFQKWKWWGPECTQNIDLHLARFPAHLGHIWAGRSSNLCLSKCKTISWSFCISCSQNVYGDNTECAHFVTYLFIKREICESVTTLVNFHLDKIKSYLCTMSIMITIAVGQITLFLYIPETLQLWTKPTNLISNKMESQWHQSSSMISLWLSRTDSLKLDNLIQDTGWIWDLNPLLATLSSSCPLSFQLWQVS